MPTRATSKRSWSRTSTAAADSRAAKKQKTAHYPVYDNRPQEILDVFVCGEGESGELGLSAWKRDEKLPVGVKSPRLNDLASSFGIVQIAVGGMHCAALTQNSKVVTWGVNDDGALGRNTQLNSEADDNDNMKNEKDDSNSDSKGDDDDLGLNPLESTPIAISSDLFRSDASSLVQVVASDSATFVLTAHGTVYGWGTFKSKNGTFGFSTKELSNRIKIQKTPLLIPGLKKIKYLAAGVNHVLALDASGTVFSWGVGENGELGWKSYNTRRPTTGSSSLTPSPVFLPGIKVVSIACGHHHSFAIDSNRHVYAWGLNNYRQTGISAGTGNYINVIQLPTRVLSLDSFEIQGIAGGLHHSIACCKDGTVLAWGRCHDSQMGLPLDTVSPKLLLKDGQGRPEILLAPTPVPNVSAATVAAGIDNSVAITADGKPYAWGYSQSYRTGLRTEDSVSRPTLITNSSLATRRITFAGCGGQFLVLASPKVVINGVKSA